MDYFDFRNKCAHAHALPQNSVWQAALTGHEKWRLSNTDDSPESAYMDPHGIHQNYTANNVSTIHEVEVEHQRCKLH